jgi:hypothetical protein
VSNIDMVKEEDFRKDEGIVINVGGMELEIY